MRRPLPERGQAIDFSTVGFPDRQAKCVRHNGDFGAGLTDGAACSLSGDGEAPISV